VTDAAAADPRRRAKYNNPVLKSAFWPDLEEGSTPMYIVQPEIPGWSKQAAQATPFGGFHEVHNCPRATVEIGKVISNFLNTRKFKAMQSNI
jgi:hypothetical protein